MVVIPCVLLLLRLCQMHLTCFIMHLIYYVFWSEHQPVAGEYRKKNGQNRQKEKKNTTVLTDNNRVTKVISAILANECIFDVGYNHTVAHTFKCRCYIREKNEGSH